MSKKIVHLFDRLEDRIRSKLSHFPIVYAFIGGVGIVLFWRGVWHTTDFITLFLVGESNFTLFDIVDGPMSFIVGTFILLITGVYVSAFIGNRLIITGLSGEKKLAEKTEEEIKSEVSEIKDIQETLDKVEDKINKIEKEIESHHRNN